MKKGVLRSSYYVVSEDYKFGDRHVDQPIEQIIVLGLIYFDPAGDDPFMRGTVFNSWDRATGIVVPSGHEQGWLLINSDKSYHRICNFGPKRYGIKFWVNVF